MQLLTHSPNSQMPLPDKAERLRALIVESNALWANAHAAFLIKEGCSVMIVSNIDEALELMQACYFHIIILETQEIILLEFIVRHKWSDYMVVCVFSEKMIGSVGRWVWSGDEQTTGKIIDINNVLFFSKEDYYPSKFWEHIKSELKDKGLIGRLSIDKAEFIETLSYQMTNNLIEHIDSTRLRNKLHPHDLWVKAFYEANGYEILRTRVEYEIYDLLRRVIDVSKINTIQLVSINGGLSKAAVIGIIPKIEDKWSKTYILKLGYHKEIQDERDAYDNHVKFMLERGPTAENGPKTPLLSSIMYAFVENGRSFGEVYKDMTYVSTEEIEALLEDLFKGVYREWFRNPTDSKVVADDYVNYLNCHINRFIDPIEHIASQPELGGRTLWSDHIQLPNIPVLLPNPIHVLDDKAFLEKQNYVAPYAITHGDLNANNILIRNNSEAWLIDFARTEKSHALRDFIQLETVVRFALLDGPTLRERYEMESYLADQGTFGQVTRLRKSYNPTGPNAKALERAFRITCKIRELAWEMALSKQDSSRQIAKFEQYKMGLFFMSLTTVRFVKHKRKPNGLSTTQALHALMAAALLVKSLK